MPWAKHSWHLASFGGDVLCYTVAWTEPPHVEDICAVAPNSCPARPSPQPPHPRRPARPQAASAVGISLRTVHQGCPTCQLRANATEKGRRRVPTLASGAPPRERKDAVWAGFEVTGGLWVLRARSARFSSVKHARTRTHAHAHTRTYTHTHRLTRTAVQGAPIRRIRPPQSILILTCCAHRTESPNPAYFGWRQEMRERDSRHSAASAGLFAPTGEPASRGSLRAMHMGVAAQHWLLGL